MPLMEIQFEKTEDDIRCAFRALPWHWKYFRPLIGTFAAVPIAGLFALVADRFLFVYFGLFASYYVYRSWTNIDKFVSQVDPSFFDPLRLQVTPNGLEIHTSHDSSYWSWQFLRRLIVGKNTLLLLLKSPQFLLVPRRAFSSELEYQEFGKKIQNQIQRATTVPCLRADLPIVGKSQGVNFRLSRHKLDALLKTTTHPHVNQRRATLISWLMLIGLGVSIPLLTHGFQTSLGLGIALFGYVLLIYLLTSVFLRWWHPQYGTPADFQLIVTEPGVIESTEWATSLTRWSSILETGRSELAIGFITASRATCCGAPRSAFESEADFAEMASLAEDYIARSHQNEDPNFSLANPDTARVQESKNPFQPPANVEDTQ